MQLVVAALLPLWRGVGDGFTSCFPSDTVAHLSHGFDEIRAGFRRFEGQVNRADELELPAFALQRGPVLAGLQVVFLRWLDNRQPILHADFVRLPPQVMDAAPRHLQFFARFKAHGIDHQVRVDMFPVGVSSHKNLMPGEAFLRKSQPDLVGLVRRDLSRREALYILVEEHPLGLAVLLLGRHELFECRFRAAVLAADKMIISEECFVLPGAVVHHLAHGGL